MFFVESGNAWLPIERLRRLHDRLGLSKRFSRYRFDAVGAVFTSGHFQEKLYRVSVGDAVVLFEERDLISSAAARETFPAGVAGGAGVHRKRFVLIRVERTQCAFLRVLSQPDLVH